jgi:hypothetical protein
MKNKLNLKEVKKAIAEIIKEQNKIGDYDSQLTGGVPWSQLGGEDSDIRTTFTQMGKDISKDAEKLADHPLLDKINTKDEWVDIMNALMIHANSISTVSDSIKKTTLLDMIKTVGKQ